MIHTGVYYRVKAALDLSRGDPHNLRAVLRAVIRSEQRYRRRPARIRHMHAAYGRRSR